ncbi:hypothetical protein N7447_004913 [Penicillium robsamsonii]|uniref:uncharacterized protein n=1 Tax=Penicillium robsamsonii TaxID=1792511 RepID=UPI0025480D06|nr:uncharacterized protein N7447_004913 [Penicillium robsamsonii]KAJ5822573.1 hypothetical protein N7447_004913 [Penicillium robsamsonii]
MPVTNINSLAEFHKAVSGDKPVVVEFWATWDGPCRVIRPIFERISELPTSSTIGFYQVDVDEQPDAAQEAGVRAMPTFAVYQGGAKVNEMVGANPGGLEELVKGIKIV